MTQYDTIALDYQRISAAVPLRDAEWYSLQQRLGDLAGLSVLDLACGDGMGTRLIKRWGAARVVGVDISAQMIALAQQREEAEPMGIEYRVADAATLGGIGPFDRVAAAYLLHYAESREQRGVRAVDTIWWGGESSAVPAAEPIAQLPARREFGSPVSYPSPAIPAMSARLGRSEPDCSRSLEPFYRRLAAVVGRCAHCADVRSPQDCLRSESNRPRTLQPGYFEAVRSVSPHWAKEEGLSHTRTLAGGRLLVYFPDADLSDGAAEAETRGFFDVFNAPPWDTWVGFFGPGGWTGDSYAHYLLAWIPPAFLDLVSGGIYVNPEECIRWIEDSDVPLRRLLAAECPRLLWPQTP